MSNFKNLVGSTFGYLKVISPDNSRKGKNKYWLCECECGKQRSLQTYQLTSGKVTSCGCKNPRHIKSLSIKPNKRIYSVYSQMLARCYNPKSTSYKYYGGKGISVCDEWLNNFDLFLKWSIENGYTDKLSIDRIDNFKGYSPSNCRWIPLKDQFKNKTNNVLIEHNGQTHIMSEWCKILDFSYTLAKSRKKECKKKNLPLTFEYIFAPKKRNY